MVTRSARSSPAPSPPVYVDAIVAGGSGGERRGAAAAAKPPGGIINPSKLAAVALPGVANGLIQAERARSTGAQ